MANESKNEITVSTKPRAEIAEPRPAQVFGSLDEVERLFDRLMPRSWMRPMAWNWPAWSSSDETIGSTRAPQLDVVDRDKDILIRCEIPGVEKKDIDVSINDSTLVIKGSVSQESKEERKNYYRCEISQGNFSRSLALPSGVESTKVSAHLKNGVLEIVLPKEEGAQRRSVEVK